MKTFGWKRLLSLVSATTMLLLMIFTVYPITALADVERTADLMSASVTYETDDGATASLSADGQSIVVTATQVNASTGLCGVTIDFSQPTAFDMTALNGLLMSVQSSVPFKMAVRVIQVGGTQDEYAFPGSAENMGRYFPQSGNYVDAGVYQDVLMDLNGICASGNFSDKSCVAINRIRFVMSGTGTLTLSCLKAAVCEDTIATSLLPSSASAFTQHEANGSTITATAVGTGGYTLTPTNGSWPAVSYAQTVQASLNATLYYNLTVTGSCNPLLFFNGGTAASYTAGQTVTIGKLIDPSISGEDLPAGRYVGSVSIADLVTYYKNTLGGDAIDIVDSGMVTISCAKIFAVSSAVTVHELSVAEPEAVSGPLDLMPADVSAIDGLSYDDSGRLVYTASAAGTVTFPVEKYYDINTYSQLFATISSTVGCDILVNGVGISTSSDAVTAITSNLRGDWSTLFSWMSADFAEQAIQANFIGSPNWNKVIPGNGMYYIKSVTLKLDGAGTMTVRGLRMDTASYVPTVDAVTLTVGQVKGAAGELVYLPVSLQSKQGIANMDATVHFDSSLLEPVQQTDASAESVWALWNTEVIGSGSSVVCDSYYNTDTGNLCVSYISGTTGVNSAATG
ncbi:MAG: cohesin domain-containing protein, partial [Acutalibacteraceae bacterium]